MFLDIAIRVLMEFFDYLPSFDLSTTAQMFDTFFEYVDIAAYFVPMDTITTILKIVIAEELFKITLSIIKLILSFIPFIGG